MFGPFVVAGGTLPFANGEDGLVRWQVGRIVGWPGSGVSDLPTDSRDGIATRRPPWGQQTAQQNVAEENVHVRKFLAAVSDSVKAPRGFDRLSGSKCLAISDPGITF